MKLEEAKAHLKDAEWSYLRHLGHVIHMNAWLVLIFVVSLIHGIHPGLFKHTASDQLTKMYEYQKEILAKRGE